MSKMFQKWYQDDDSVTILYVTGHQNPVVVVAMPLVWRLLSV